MQHFCGSKYQKGEGTQTFLLKIPNKGNAEDWRNNAGIFWKTYLRMDAETGALFAKNIDCRRPWKWRDCMKIKMQYNCIEVCRDKCNLCHFESEYITWQSCMINHQ